MPWGAYTSKFEKLNSSEKIWVTTHPTCVSIVQENAQKALTEAQRRFSPDTLHNGAGDAFRHCYWPALMTRDMGFINTKGFTDAHENYDGNPPGQKAMDIHNNLQGMVIGIRNGRASDALLAEACQNALKEGGLKVLTGI